MRCVALRFEAVGPMVVAVDDRVLRMRMCVCVCVCMRVCANSMAASDGDGHVHNGASTQKPPESSSSISPPS